MKQFIFLFFLISLNTSFNLFAQSKVCGTQHHPTAKWHEGEDFIQNWSIEQLEELNTRSVITIPVVVHVIWHTSAENISDEQIYSQIDVLNEDFRAMNENLDQVPVVFQDVIADVEIEFCLAQVDPNGNPTTGITRTFTQALSSVGSTNIHYTSQGGHDAWDTEHYLNIWVANSTSLAGIASFPGQGVAAEDGVEIAYDYFGKLANEPPYHLGRTTTHEIGHYFNLFHPWGPDTPNCDDDDLVEDTPLSSKNYLGKCPNHPANSCNSNDMFMNFMYWADDDCLSMFSEGQKVRILATLNSARAGLLESGGCLPLLTKEEEINLSINIFPNPAQEKIHLQFSKPISDSTPFLIFDVLGHRMIELSNNSSSDFTLDVSDLESGLYFIKVGRFVKQFVKN